jgi:hypothetical protein
MLSNEKLSIDEDIGILSQRLEVNMLLNRLLGRGLPIRRELWRVSARLLPKPMMPTKS